MIHGKLPIPVLPILALALLLQSCGNSAGVATTQASDVPTPRVGGQATVLLTANYAGAWPAGLDPATNITGGANLSLMNAIYGGLFQLMPGENGAPAQVVGVLASGYEMSDGGRVVKIHLRENVVFSDGTPFNAEAVKFNIERNLKSACSCSPTAWPWANDNPVDAPDEHTVVLHFASPYGPVMNAFPGSNINWIASPTALRRLGEEEFKMKPVGAGPFRVVSNELSTRLVLERNPRYWQAGHPYLDRLTFQSIGSEQAAYQALLAGDADAFENMSSNLLITRAEQDKRVTVTRQPPTSPMFVQLNTLTPPFNDARAREAIYYATDAEAIRMGMFHGAYPTAQSFTAPGGLFYQKTVPTYRTHDLAKARALVRQLGELRVRLGTLRSMTSENVMVALQSQWTTAGIDVSIEAYDLATLVRKFESREWQAMLQTAGSYDPDAGAGLGFRFRSDSTFSGVHDAELDKLLDRGIGTVDSEERRRCYLAVARYLSDKAYAPFLLATEPAQLTRHLFAPGLTTQIPAVMITPAVLWQDAWVSRER